MVSCLTILLLASVVIRHRYIGDEADVFVRVCASVPPSFELSVPRFVFFNLQGCIHGVADGSPVGLAFRNLLTAFLPLCLEPRAGLGAD